MNAGGATHKQELAIELIGKGLDALVDVGQEGSKDVLHVVLLQHLLERDQRLLGISLGVGIDELERVLLTSDLEAASLVDLVNGHTHPLGGHPAIRVERTGLRLYL